MKVTELYTYPVKSLAGISLQSATLTETGFQHDRQWMVVEPNGKFMTQREHPQMALIETAMEENKLVLSTFGMERLVVDKPDINQAQRLQTEVWGDRVNGIVHSDDTHQWLSDAIGVDCKLVLFPSSEKRQCDPNYSDDGDNTLFADGFPLLLISQESLDDLNGKLDVAVGMDRFRPNIVVQGCNPFDEDLWKNVQINEVGLRAVKACARCSVPTIDQSRGMLAGPEPIATLSTYRQKENGEIYFGMNMIPNTLGTIRVGDSASILN